MINKIFVFGGMAAAAILIIENLVIGLQAYVFIDSNSTAGFLSLISTIIGVFIGYGFRGMFEKKASDDENYDF